MLDAVKALLRSRKALLAFLGSGVALAVYFVPALEPAQGPALTFVEAALALLAAFITIEDAAEKAGVLAASVKADATVDAAKVDAGLSVAAPDKG